MNKMFKSFRARLVALLTAVFHAPAGFTGQDELCLANSVAEKTHQESVSKLADAAHSYRYLLVKPGTDADHIAVNGAADKPLGVCSDTPEAAEDIVDVHLLGATRHTRLCVASEAIANGADIYTAAAGKVQDEPAAAGTFWRIGKARNAAGADLDLIEVETHDPIKVVVLAELTAPDTANGSDLATTQALANALKADLISIETALATPAELKLLNT